jgi:hypothetical protein
MVRKHQTRNLEIPGLRLTAHPGMTERHLPTHFGGRFSENAFGPSM